MKRIAAFVFAFLSVWYLQATDADAQFRRECRAGFCVPGGSPSGTPVSNACINSSGTTITFTAQGVGGANPRRISVITINWSDSTAAGTAQLNSVTIGGLAMGRVARVTSGVANSNSEIWSVPNPTGTSANIVATFATAVDGVTIEVYSLVGYNSVVATTTGTTSVSQAYTNKQLAIAAASRTTNVSTSLSNMVNDYSSACGAGLWGVHASQKLTGSGTLTSSISPTGNNPKIVLAVWNTQGITTSCTQSANFLARTVGLDIAHQNNYNTLICGLVTDGIFAKLDLLRIYATQDSTNALLNLVSSSYTGTTAGSPAFQVDRGFTGVDASTTVYINSGLFPSSSPSLNFTRDSAHHSTWSVLNTTSSASGGLVIGTSLSPVLRVTNIAPRYSDGNAYFRVNGSNIGGVAVASGAGFYIANRSGATALQGYKNGVSVLTSADPSQALSTSQFTDLAEDSGTVGGPNFGGAAQIAGSSVGGSLSSTDAANFNTRMRTYMTAVGVP